MRVRRAVIAFLLLCLTAGPLAAVEPSEMLSDPALEARARAIGLELRCLVCQNQSIDDSDADLARDLRVLIRERLLEGDTDEGVIAYVVDRYGDYVLLRPPFKPKTYLLWLGPALLLAVAFLAAWAFYRSQRAQRGQIADALSPSEEARARRLLGEDET